MQKLGKLAVIDPSINLWGLIATEYVVWLPELVASWVNWLGQFHFYTWFAHCPLVFALSLHLAQNGFSAISGPC